MIANVTITDGDATSFIEVVDHPWYDPSLPDDHWQSYFQSFGHVGWGDWKEQGPKRLRVLRLFEKCSEGRHVVLELADWTWRADAVGRGWHYTPGKRIKHGEVAWKITSCA